MCKNKNTNLDGRYPDCVVVTWVIPSLLGSDVLTDIGEFGLEVVRLLKQNNKTKKIIIKNLKKKKNCYFYFTLVVLRAQPLSSSNKKTKVWIKRIQWIQKEIK